MEAAHATAPASAKENLASHHVKFNIEEEEIKTHHENIEIERVNERTFSIRLGYLKVQHHYKVKFELDLSELLADQLNASRIKFLADKSSHHMTFKEVKASANARPGHFTFSLVFHSLKEKFDVEHAYFSVQDSHDSDVHHTLVLNFEARVLGINQGTPMLRNGIVMLHNVSDNHGHHLLHHQHSHSAGEQHHKPHFNVN